MDYIISSLLTFPTVNYWFWIINYAQISYVPKYTNHCINVIQTINDEYNVKLGFWKSTRE